MNLIPHLALQVATLVLATLPMLAQVTITVKPVSISGARGALGSHQVGLWTVSLTSRYGVPAGVPRERITQAFPLLRDIPNRLAEDLLTRQSSQAFWSIVARWGPTLLTVAGATYGAHGIAAGNNSQAWIGQGTALAPLLLGRAAQRAPQPNPYFSEFCPERITLAAFGAAACYLASSVVNGAATMTALIDLPDVRQPELKPPEVP
jgi:hypothetical protein